MKDAQPKSKKNYKQSVRRAVLEWHLIWVGTGRTSDVFSSFLKKSPKETALGIKAVAMDMDPYYQKAVRENLPHADIVFDRFHVMQNYSKAISNQRRVEFRKADLVGKKLFKSCHYQLLKNADKLKPKHTVRLDILLIYIALIVLTQTYR